MKTAYIGIGSNLGDAHHHCLTAVGEIERIPGCILIGTSPWYMTEAVGVKNQDWYVNGVLSVSVNLSAQGLIHHLLHIEMDMGRVRKERWESRIIDLDILLYGEDIIRQENLTIPHPLMHERRFVLTPMVDLAPELIHPLLKKTMTELLALADKDGQVVERIKA
ncbi:MAG: 2-amino-4-hydroxy-6-hydroxymethyldihydropteridine diphosphokinase [Deltaproteobacteria bacterium]|nr:2-amino-4-hydroxy-6-hydroxymethyldihydropteridine diphosphokinase [Deltaproteobacteria bacterium]